MVFVCVCAFASVVEMEAPWWGPSVVVDRNEPGLSVTRERLVGGCSVNCTRICSSSGGEAEACRERDWYRGSLTFQKVTQASLHSLHSRR